MTAVPHPAAPRTSPRTSVPRRVVSVLVLALLTVPLLAGCLRAQVSMGVSSNDRVSGRIVAATVQIGRAHV